VSTRLAATYIEELLDVTVPGALEDPAVIRTLRRLDDANDVHKRVDELTEDLKLADTRQLNLRLLQRNAAQS
jgi:hypothetical protein